MFKTYFRAALISCIFASGIGSIARAASITVPNGDFETNGGTRTGQTNSQPPSWTQTGTFGTFQPATTGGYTASGYATNANFQANNHGLLLGFAQGGASLTQTLTSTYQASTTYTLSVLVGDSYEAVSGNYTIQLGSGSTVYTSFPSTAFPANAYTSTNATTSFSTASTPAAVGLPITISILTTTGASKTFDNVALDAVPEPGSLSLLGVGGIAALRRRRRRA